MHKKIYLLLGLSGAGKDTTADALLVGGHISNICKFAAPGKALFESIHGLPSGTLNDKLKRLEMCPGTNQSYLDRFIYWFHHQHEIFPPGFFRNQAMSQIDWALVNGSIAITDLRDPLELKALIDYVLAAEATAQQVELVTGILHRTNCEPQTSDLHLQDNVKLLRNYVGTNIKEPAELINLTTKNIYQNIEILTNIS